MLHTLSHSPWQCDIDALLSMLRDGDDLLLIQDGVLAAQGAFDPLRDRRGGTGNVERAERVLLLAGSGSAQAKAASGQRRSGAGQR